MNSFAKFVLELKAFFSKFFERAVTWFEKLKGTSVFIRTGAVLKNAGYIIASAVLLYAIFFLFAPWVENKTPGLYYQNSNPDSTFFTGKKPAENYLKALKRENDLLEQNLRRLIPSRSYLVVNTSENKIYLYSGGKLIHEGICSTGSYTLLKAGEDQEWVFKTPKGMFTIQGKVVSPVWRKPDWAFIEEGLPVPSASSHLRFEAGVLGDYALSLGDGYLIHGTLFQRFLGLPVTHGCIRLGDEDLKKVYNSLHIGSKVYIY